MANRISDKLPTFPARRVAQGLGWFSVGLGLAELLAPRLVGKAIGISDGPANRWLLRGFGLREIAAGVGLLATRKTSTFMWARVAGDAADLACLGVAIANRDNDRALTGAALATVATITALDVATAVRCQAEQPEPAHTVAVTVGRDADQLAQLWKDYESVEALPFESASAAIVAAPGRRGAEVHLEYPAGMSVPSEMYLRRFKQWVELGEVMHSDASIHTALHPAQPALSVGGEVVRS